VKKSIRGIVNVLSVAVGKLFLVSALFVVIQVSEKDDKRDLTAVMEFAEFVKVHVVTKVSL